MLIRPIPISAANWVLLALLRISIYALTSGHWDELGDVSVTVYVYSKAHVKTTFILPLSHGHESAINDIAMYEIDYSHLLKHFLIRELGTMSRKVANSHITHAIMYLLGGLFPFSDSLLGPWGMSACL